jgi:hypothetical protein
VVSTACRTVADIGRDDTPLLLPSALVVVVLVNEIDGATVGTRERCIVKRLDGKRSAGTSTARRADVDGSNDEETAGGGAMACRNERHHRRRSIISGCEAIADDADHKRGHLTVVLVNEA